MIFAIFLHYHDVRISNSIMPSNGHCLSDKPGYILPLKKKAPTETVSAFFNVAGGGHDPSTSGL